jgi:hypothetical protein
MKRTGTVILCLLVCCLIILWYFKSSDPSCPLQGSAKSDRLRELNKLKNRSNFPVGEDFDTSVTLERMLEDGNDEDRWDASKAAAITGYVKKVKSGDHETCNCEAEDDSQHDTHIEIVTYNGDKDKAEKVIVEITPRIRDMMREKGIDWSTAELRRSILNKKVRVEGWLLFDFEHEAQSANTGHGKNIWRGTAWEIHPITSLQVIPDN